MQSGNASERVSRSPESHSPRGEDQGAAATASGDLDASQAVMPSPGESNAAHYPGTSSTSTGDMKQLLESTISQLLAPDASASDLRAGFVNITSALEDMRRHRVTDPNASDIINQAVRFVALCCLEGLGTKPDPGIALEVLGQCSDSSPRTDALRAWYHYSTEDRDPARPLHQAALDAGDRYAQLISLRSSLTESGTQENPEVALALATALTAGDASDIVFPTDDSIITELARIEQLRCLYKLEQQDQVREVTDKLLQSPFPPAWYHAAIELLTHMDLFNEEEIESAKTAVIRAADAKYYPAVMLVAKNYAGEEGVTQLGLPRDRSLSLEYLLHAAEQNDIASQFAVATALKLGHGIQQDYGQAFQWFSRAVALGDLQSKLEVAKMHILGRGVDVSASIGYELIVECVEAKYVPAYSYMGDCYAHGYHVQQDSAKAFEWYMKGAQEGDSVAEFKVGLAYSEGTGVELDEAKSIEWFLKSADKGNSDAESFLGELYYYGRGGVERNPEKALQFTRRAAEKGNPLAMYSLGRCYAQGQIVEQDDSMAFEWYLKAAEIGDAHAQVAVGLHYLKGAGVPQDLERAYDWFNQSFNRGLNEPGYWLGMFYYRGWLGERDVMKAYKYWYICADGGDLDSQYEVARMLSEGTELEPDLPVAAEWALRAANRNHPKAQYLIGLMYLHGQGVEKDEKEAVRWLSASAENGDATAKEVLESFRAIPAI